MQHVIEPDTHTVLGQGPFRIRRIRPGLGIDEGDTGFGPLGLVDRAHLSAGLVVSMHEHVDDEIVSYLRSGSMTHTDSDGNSEAVTRDRLMVMNSGAGFSHEERMPEGEDIHMLQIFVRPREAGLAPRVQFAELDESMRTRGWRAIVGPDTVDGEIGPDGANGAPASVRQDVRIGDARVDAGRTIDLPTDPRGGTPWNQWLYVFDGDIELPDGTRLGTGAAVATSGDDVLERVRAVEDSELVLFELDPAARFSLAGSLSRGR